MTRQVQPGPQILAHWRFP